MDDDLRRRLDNLKKRMGLYDDQSLCEPIGCTFVTLKNWLEGKVEMSRIFRRSLRELELRYKTDLTKNKRLRKPKEEGPF